MIDWKKIGFRDAVLVVVLLSMSIFFLSLAYTVLFNGGLEYTVKIGR